MAIWKKDEIIGKWQLASYWIWGIFEFLFPMLNAFNWQSFLPGLGLLYGAFPVPNASKYVWIAEYVRDGV